MTEFGHVSLLGGYWCEPDFQQNPPPSGGACLPSTGCQSFQLEHFTPDSTCGQPQGCGNTAQWGCVFPLVNVNGVCQRSIEYQNTCASGYNSSTCACNPSPAPTPPPGDECNTCNGTGQFYCGIDNRAGGDGGTCCDPIEQWACEWNGGSWNPYTCTCGSPIVVDILGDGFDLTGPSGGVMFRLDNTGVYRQTAWTAARSDEAWLVLDRNGNGTIDSGRELFGDSTPQPQLQPGEVKNGFRALAVFDRLDRGGNNDGFINRDDTVFDDLRLWTDENHNGISEAGELRSLRDAGLKRIDLDYRESRRRDAHGNWFRFRSKVRDARDANISRWAWDVFLQQ